VNPEPRETLFIVCSNIDFNCSIGRCSGRATIDRYAGGTGGEVEMSVHRPSEEGSQVFDFGHEKCGRGSTMAIKSKWR